MVASTRAVVLKLIRPTLAFDGRLFTKSWAACLAALNLVGFRSLAAIEPETSITITIFDWSLGVEITAIGRARLTSRPASLSAKITGGKGGFQPGRRPATFVR